MTGFGKGEAAYMNRKFTVEIRTVNSKQLDLSLKLPGRYRSLEAEIRSTINSLLKRGKVECYVSYESVSTETSAHINQPVFKAYVEQLQEAARKSNLDTSCVGWDGHLLQAVLRMPDVISCEEQGVSPEELQALLQAVEEATNRNHAFRAAEGAVLTRDLVERVQKIEGLLEKVAPYEQSRTERIRERIREQRWIRTAWSRR